MFLIARRFYSVGKHIFDQEVINFVANELKISNKLAQSFCRSKNLYSFAKEKPQIFQNKLKMLHYQGISLPEIVENGKLLLLSQKEIENNKKLLNMNPVSKDLICGEIILNPKQVLELSKKISFRQQFKAYAPWYANELQVDIQVIYDNTSDILVLTRHPNLKLFVIRLMIENGVAAENVIKRLALLNSLSLKNLQDRVSKIRILEKNNMLRKNHNIFKKSIWLKDDHSFNYYILKQTQYFERNGFPPDIVDKAKFVAHELGLSENLVLNSVQEKRSTGVMIFLPRHKITGVVQLFRNAGLSGEEILELSRCFFYKESSLTSALSSVQKAYGVTTLNQSHLSDIWCFLVKGSFRTKTGRHKKPTKKFVLEYLIGIGFDYRLLYNSSLPNFPLEKVKIAATNLKLETTNLREMSFLCQKRLLNLLHYYTEKL